MQARTLTQEQLLPVLREAVDSGGSFQLTVTGSSMAPTLKPGRDSVELHKAPPRKGDIVLFQRTGGECILHRVIRCRKDLLTVNGDNQRWSEDIHPSQVIAVVRSLHRDGRQIYCRSPLYRAYSALWMLLRPLRSVIAGLRQR